MGWAARVPPAYLRRVRCRHANRSAARPRGLGANRYDQGSSLCDRRDGSGRHDRLLSDLLSGPVNPALAEHYGVSLSAAGWISGAFGLSYALGFLIFGPLSDSFGRRRMMVWGIAPLVITTAALWQAGSFESIIVLRIVQGFAAATFTPTAIAYVAETIPEKLRPTALAIVGGSFLMSTLLGQIFGSAFGGSGDLTTIFVLSTAVYAILGIALILLPAEPRKLGSIAPAQVYRALPHLLRHPFLARGFVIGLTILFSFVGYYAAISIHLGDVVRDAGFDMIEIRYFGLPGLALTFFAGIIIRRFTAARVARTGFIIAALGLVISGATSTGTLRQRRRTRNGAPTSPTSGLPRDGSISPYSSTSSHDVSSAGQSATG